MIKKAKHQLLKENCKKIGSVIKTFGYKGQIIAELFLNLEDIETEFIFVEIDNCLIPFFIDKNESKFKNNSATLKFYEITSIEDTPTIINCDLYLPTNLIPTKPEKKTAYDYLVGYEIVDINKKRIGISSEIIDITKNPILNIKTPEDELLLPINGIKIINIDKQNMSITIDIPSGYLDL